MWCDFLKIFQLFSQVLNLVFYLLECNKLVIWKSSIWSFHQPVSSLPPSLLVFVDNLSFVCLVIYCMPGIVFVRLFVEKSQAWVSHFNLLSGMGGSSWATTPGRAFLVHFYVWVAAFVVPAQGKGGSPGPPLPQKAFASRVFVHLSLRAGLITSQLSPLESADFPRASELPRIGKAKISHSLQAVG